MFYTYAQVERIEKYIEQIRNLRKSNLRDEKFYHAVSHLDDMISTSYQEYNPNIHWAAAIVEDDPYGECKYNNDRILEFLEVMEASLQGILNGLDQYSEICSIREAITRGEELLTLNKDPSYEDECQLYVRDILLKHSGLFSSVQSSYFSGKSFEKSSLNIKTIMDILQQNLQSMQFVNLATFKSYKGAEQASVTKPNIPTIQITNNSHGGMAISNSSAEATSKVDMSIKIEQTIEQVKDACLNPEEEAAILAKLEEIKEIAEERNKKTRWEKLKGVFKWLAEQSLQAAAWVIPLIAQLIQPI